MKTSLKAKLTSLTLGLTMALGGLVGLGAEAAKESKAEDSYVTMAYSGSSTTNMSGNNDASKLGLDPDEWTVVADKGGNGNFPGLNKAGQIRLYGADANHNKITITSVGEKTITYVIVSYGSSNYQGKVTVGDSTITGTGSDAEKTYTINSNSFSILHNYTTTTQVYILSAKIYYSTGSTTEATKLDAPTNISVDNKTGLVTWDSVENASSYAVCIDDQFGSYTALSSGSIIPGWASLSIGPHTIYIKSIGDGTNYSDSNAENCDFVVPEPIIEGQFKLEFPLASNPGNWPTTNSTTLTDYTYSLNNVNYTFGLKNIKCNTGYLMLTATAVLGLPAVANSKLVKVAISNSSTCSNGTIVGISSSSSSESYITGGDKKTFSTTDSTYYYNLSGTAAETVYYIYVTSKNCQITSIELTYEEIPVNKYLVTNSLTNVTSNGAEGSEAANSGADYVATLTPADGYDIVTLNSVAVGSSILTSGQDYTFTNNILTIKKASITGNITINAQASKSEYTVHASGTGVSFGTDGTDPQKASYKTEYSISFTVLPGYDAPTSVSATCDGETVPASLSGTTVTISAANVTGNLVITANGTLKTYTLLTTSLSNITLEDEPTSFTHGQEFSTKLNAVTGYTLNNATITVTMGGETVPNAYNASSNTVTISYVTGNVVISGSAIYVPESSIEIIKTTFDVKKDIQNATIEITWSNATINNVSVGLDTAQSTSNVASFGEFQRESSGNSGTVAISADSQTSGGQSYYKVTVNYINHLGNPDTKVFPILVKVAVDSLESISLSSTSGTFKLGDSITLPTVIGKYSLTGETEVEATWTEYDPYLVGTQTVTASFSGKNAYYTLKIEAKDYTTYTEAKEEYSYDKVTSSLTDWTGKYLIVCEDDGSHGDLAFDGSLDTLDAVSNTVGVTISDNKIETNKNGIVGNKAFYFEVEHITGITNAYTLKSASGYYISGTAKTNKASNGLKQASEYSNYEIYFNNLEIESKSSDKNMILRYNATSGQTRFRFYSSGQQSISLYKFTDHSVQASSTPSDEKHAVTCYSAGFYGEAAYAGKEADLSQFSMDVLFDTGERELVAPTSISPLTFVEGENNYTITYEDGYGQKLEKTLSISAVPESFEVIPMITTYSVNTGVQTYDYNAILNDKLINNGECEVTPTQFTDTGVQTVTVKYGDFEDSYEVLVIDSSYYNRLTFVVNQDAYINGNLKTNTFYWGNDLFNIEFGGKTFSFNNSIFSCEINCISRNNPLTPWDFYTTDYKGKLGVESGFADGIAIKDVMSNEAIYDTYDKFKVRFDGEGIAEYYIDAHDSYLCDYPEIYEDESVPMNLGNYKAYHFDYATGQSTDVTESVVWTRDKASGNSCYIQPTINGQQFDRAFAARIMTIEPTKYANELKSLDGLNVGDVIVLGVEDPMSTYLLGAGIFSGSTMVTASANYTVSNSGEPGTIGIVDTMDYYRITLINGNEITCTAKDNKSFTFTISIDNAANATVTYSGATAYYNKDSNRFEFMPQTAVGSNPSYVLPHIYFYRDYTPFDVEQLTHSFIYEGDTVYLGYSENGSTGYSAGYFSFGDLSAPGIATTFKNGSMNIQYSTDGLVLGNYNETNKTFSLKDTQLNQTFYGNWSMSVNEATKEATITCPDGGYQIFFDTSANNFVISMVGADGVYTNYKLPTAYVKRTAQTYAQEYFDYYLRFGYYDSTVKGTGECTSMGYYNKAKMRLAQIMNKPGVINALLSNQEALARLNEWARNNNEQLDLNTGSFVPLVKGIHNLFSGAFDDNPILNEVATPKGLYISLIVVGVGIAAIGATGLRFKRKED